MRIIKIDGKELVLDCPAHGFWCSGCLFASKVPINTVSERWLIGYWSWKLSTPKAQLASEDNHADQ